MCGLAGIVSPFRNDHENELKHLLPYLARRGPDDQNQYNIGACTFIHARLAINDLSANARQPFVNDEQTVMAMCNGEIYNYPELRTRVLSNGHRLRSHSDNEILIHLYQDYGVELFNIIEGEFAIAIWDSRHQKLILARDRFGVKPLYYLRQADNIYFSSDFSSLAHEILINKTISRAAVNLYVIFRYVPAPLTLFEAIKKVSPGHYLCITPASSDVVRYWEYRPAPVELSVEEATVRVREAVLAGVESRLMSDVPIGVFLSGGLDSAILVAALKMLGRERTKTYSIGFHDEANDPGNEFLYSDIVAQTCGTDHTKIVATETAFYDTFNVWIEAMGEPVGAPAAIPLLQLAKRASQDVKVILNGQGADEMFGGYFWYQAMCQRYGQQPPPLLFLDCYAGIQEDHKNRLLTEPWRQPGIATSIVSGVFEQLESSVIHMQPLSTATFLDAHFGLPEVGLKEVDAVTMYFGLEARVPFLAATVISVAAGISQNLKMNGGIEKYILRRAFADVLPPAIGERRKLGFPVPVSTWYKGQLGEIAREVVLSRRALNRGIFDEEQLRHLVMREELSSDCSRNQTFRFLVLELWLRRFVENDDWSALSHFSQPAGAP